MNTGRKRRRSQLSGGVVFLTLALALGAGPAPASATLPDGRGWELASPVDKNGGQVDPPGAIADGGVLQASAGAGAITYGSAASFAGAAGAPPASQYVATRSAAGWSTQNITSPIFSGSYDLVDVGVPYQLFSTDLARGILLNGDHCRGEGSDCAVASPPLAGTDAPAGYQDYYLRDSGSGAYEALLGSSDIAGLGLDPAAFDLRFAGASPDLKHVVLSSCAALTSDATEVAVGSGCDPTQQNLYEWSSGTGLNLVNLLPAQAQGNHHAVLAAQSNAVSTTGARVYWAEPGGDLYLREGGQTKQVDTDAGGGGSFETASTDGSFAFFTKGGHLWRYDEGTAHATDLTPSGGVVGALGASDTADTVYYQDAGGLRRWHSNATTTVAFGASVAAPSDYPPTTGTARVSADGTKLLFISTAQLTGYNNTDKITNTADSEVFLYDAGAGTPLTCVSCNPSGARPIGPSSIPGAFANGTASGSTDSYKPRALSADGHRVFFDTGDALVAADSNAVSGTGAGIPDVYEWEAQGEGSCAKAGGCVAIVSSGALPQSASFVDASADGSDAYFLTAASLVGSDPGSLDLYDARIGGGFPEPQPPIPCNGDACQVLPSEPSDPTLTTTLQGLGNPPVHYDKYCRKGYVVRKDICVKKGKAKRHKRHHKPKHKRRHGSGR